MNDLEIAVHDNHCCQVHGCKYGDSDCPVADKTWPGIICEDCQHPDPRDLRIQELETALKEIIQLEQNFYDRCDYIYDDEEQAKANGESRAYARCAEIAKDAMVKQ